MIISRGIHPIRLLRLTGHHIIWLLTLMAFFAFLYRMEYIDFTIPWLPVSIIGTAVAFYVGFKNNQSYDRMWEARKIWGGIVNDSRSWGMMIDGFITNQFNNSPIDQKEIKEIKVKLIYRHIAWLYAHRNQLLIPTSWEHVAQGGMMGRYARRSQRKFGIGLLDDDLTETELKKLLGQNEYQRLIDASNTATQIINQQSRDLRELRSKDLIDDFRHMELSALLKSFYTLQGKNERIKKFPLPRQYAIMSRFFVGIFIGLLPISMIPELLNFGNWGLVASIFITALIGWVFIMMEVIGDYSENPFSGMPNDIPMLSLCRTIEIDLREMLEEKELPPPIEANGDILL